MVTIYFNKHEITVDNTYDEIRTLIETAMSRHTDWIEVSMIKKRYDECENKMNETICRIAVNIQTINYVQ
jgi:uncharacterized protein YqgQ